MIIEDQNYMLMSGKSNDFDYCDGGVFPDWARIKLLRPYPGQGRGGGVEPHYHDADEIWFFTSGRGEAWLNDEAFEITPNTPVYTPMGVVHRFQMFTDYDNVALVTTLERQRRAGHILVEEDGPPVPTVPGFVVPGAENNGPFPDRGSRCPLSELRLVTLANGEGLDEERLPGNEHWLVLEGTCQLEVDGLQTELFGHDVALLRSGALRRLHSDGGARLVLARE